MLVLTQFLIIFFEGVSQSSPWLLYLFLATNCDYQLNTRSLFSTSRAGRNPTLRAPDIPSNINALLESISSSADIENIAIGPA